jgi:RNA recognition motif-containing protein
VVAKKNLRAKGQAFVVYDDPAAAAQAIKEANGFDIFDKPMRLEWAHSPSDATVKRQQGEGEEFELHKRRRLVEKGGFERFFWLLLLYRAGHAELTLLCREETSNTGTRSTAARCTTS